MGWKFKVTKNCGHTMKDFCFNSTISIFTINYLTLLYMHVGKSILQPSPTTTKPVWGEIKSIKFMHIIEGIKPMRTFPSLATKKVCKHIGSKTKTKGTQTVHTTPWATSLLNLLIYLPCIIVIQRQYKVQRQGLYFCGNTCCLCLSLWCSCCRVVLHISITL